MENTRTSGSSPRQDDQERDDVRLAILVLRAGVEIGRVYRMYPGRWAAMRDGWTHPRLFKTRRDAIREVRVVTAPAENKEPT